MMRKILLLVGMAIGLLVVPAWAVPISSFPSTIYGELSAYDLSSSGRGSGYYADHYEVNVVPGQQLTINMDTVAYNYDGYLFLLNSSGSVIASNDDFNDTRHSQIIYTATAAGTLTIETTSYSSGVYSGNGSIVTAGYNLSVASVGGSNVTTQTLSLPSSSASGSLATTDAPSRAIIGAYADNYLVSLAAGQTIAVDHASSAFDAYLTVYDANGNWLASNDDFGGTLNSHISFTASVAGTYTIEATSLSSGRTGNYTVSVTEGATTSTLTASFYAYPASGTAPLFVSFANSSYSSNGSDVLSYFWDFGNGTSSTTSSPSVTYQQAGTYNVVLTVRNQNGQSATYSQTVTAQQPISMVSATFTVGSSAPQANIPIAFYNGSYSSTGTITSYTWEFGDGQYATVANPQHTYTTAGTYTVRLSVMDSNGQMGTYSQAVTVQASVATFSVSYRISSASPRANELVTFVNQTYSATPDTFTYLWNFGDGQTSTAMNPSHTFTQAGIYIVRLTATNQLGQSADSTQTITIQSSGADLVSNFSFAVDATSGLTVAFTEEASSSLELLGDVLTYSWDFGDGQTSTDSNPTHTYTSAGSYSVVLTIQNFAGQTTASAPQTVSVSASTSGTINVSGTVRLKPQVLMGGVDPMLIDLADTSFKLVALVRPGVMPVQSVQFGSGSGGFTQQMNYSGTYSNGDQRYEATFVFPRGAFPEAAVL
ncbi:MAG: PKD domain-containing protein, partial [Pseudomonadota bacterium]